MFAVLRNQNFNELKSLNEEEQFSRLCELNVMRQTFHVCTSPVVQSAWDAGQEMLVYGMIYDLKDGRSAASRSLLSCDSCST